MKRILPKKIYFEKDVNVSMFEARIIMNSYQIDAIIECMYDNHFMTCYKYEQIIDLLRDVLRFADSLDCINCVFDLTVGDVHDELAEKGLGVYCLSKTISNYLSIDKITNFILSDDRDKNEFAVVMLNLRFILVRFLDILECIFNNCYYESIFKKNELDYDSPLTDFYETTKQYNSQLKKLLYNISILYG